jgi:hypothetical protein
VKPVAALLVASVWLAATPPRAPTIPEELLGKWVVTRLIPTETISCWSYGKAKRIVLRTEIEYSPGFFRWKNIVTKHPTASVTGVTAAQFHDENSGQGLQSSQVTFRQLGIKANEATEISVQHAPANLTGATVEIPGDHVLVKDKNTIIFSVCNVYFEATRIISNASTGKRQRP